MTEREDQMTTKTDRLAGAKEQAEAQFEHIATLMARYEHAQECDDSGCDLEARVIADGENGRFLRGVLRHVSAASAIEERDRTEYHDIESAEQAIYESPLSVEVRSDWHPPGADSEETQYQILLCTGGIAEAGNLAWPAVRIIGGLGEDSQPESATLQCQDWLSRDGFTAWEICSRPPGDEATLTRYAAISMTYTADPAWGYA